MTLPERLAREALPCSHDCHPQVHYADCPARHLPAVEDAVRKAIEACTDIADSFSVSECIEIAESIRTLLTEETP